MKPELTSQHLMIGEVAQRLDVSVRALRLYEDEGLIQPKRTLAGRRVFAEGDLARLQHIMALKKAGCTLDQIRHLLAERSIDPAALLDLQITSLKHQRESLDRTLLTLESARDRIGAGHRIGLAEFCDLINLGECQMTEQAWKQVWDRYYTPEEQARWKAAKLDYAEGDIEATQRAWTDLIGRVTAAITAGARPEDEESVAMAKEWYDLQQPLVQKLGVAMWNKGSKMYEEMEQWQTNAVQSPFSPEVYEFIRLAADAGRATGVIPPRAGS